MNHLEKIFAKQQELMNKYQLIEHNLTGNVTQINSINLNDRKYQAKLRTVAWWITEEMGEAMEQLITGKPELFEEELIDVLHFVVELCILSGITPKDLEHCFDFSVKRFIIAKMISKGSNDVAIPTHSYLCSKLGMAVNCLKNKPWKQIEVPTDKEKYQELIIEVTNTLFVFFVYVGWDMNDIYTNYMKKHQANKERQEGGY